jgi:hypothetical protein
MPRIHNEEGKYFPINVGEAIYAHAKNPCLIPYTKINLKSIQNLQL